MNERGSVTVVMMAVTALLVLFLVATASLGGLYAVRSKAASAADAAALAAAVATYPGTGRGSPESEARRIADSNGAALVDCRCPVNSELERRTVTVLVVIEVEVPIFGRVRIGGESRAEFDPMGWLGR